MNQTLRVRLAATGVLVLVLVTGFLLGVAWDRTEEARTLDTAASELSTASSSQDQPPVVDLSEDEGLDEAEGRDDEDRIRDGRGRRPLIVHGVGITEEQEREAYELVDQHRERWRALSQQMEEEYDPRFRALQLRVRESIRDLLSPEQALRYDSLLEAHDRREARKR